MEYKIITKIRQNNAWIWADIPCKNITHNRHNTIIPASVYVSNDVIIPVDSMMSQANSIATRRTLSRPRMNGTEIVLKSIERHSTMTLFLRIQGLNHGCWTVFISRVIKLNCFRKIWCMLLPRIFKKIGFQVLTINGEVITNDNCVECIVIVQCTVCYARWGKMHCAPC